jgi:phage gp46-like protein
MIDDHPLTVIVDGQQISTGTVPDEPLVRAVIVSLFTWRRANPDDELPSTDLMGWWGDSYADVQGDRIGSRLWLLSRAVLTADTVRRAEEYVREALQWLLDDQVATSLQVSAQRVGLSALSVSVLVTRAESGQVVSLRFADVWSYLKNAA